MALVPDQKFSTFFNGGALEDGDIVVGLREGLNTKFTWEIPEGVDSITGTANQVLVDGTSGTPVTGDVTLTLPQDIAATSSPTFNNLFLDGGLIKGLNNNTSLALVDVLSAVNYVQVNNSATGNSPALVLMGSDTNIGFSISSKGTGAISLQSANTTIPLTILSGTGLQHRTSFQMSNTAATRVYIWPEASGTIALTSDLTGFVTSVSGTSNRITSTGGTTPVIDISAAYVGQSSITTLGTIGTGIWQGTVVGATYGGTGVNNGANTLTLAGTLATSGAFASTFTMTGATNVTFPTSGTLATTASASGIINSGLINQLTWYAASGTTVSGLATANNGLLVTSAAGVPSIGNAILADITINGITAGRGAASVASNTAFGASALAANQAGGNLNSAFGFSALASNTTGDQNTGVGYGALSSCQADSASTAMGYLCLVNQNGGGGANTGYGFNCFGSVTLGTGNVGYGYGAGIAGASGAVALTTGTDNTFFGVLASSNAADSIGTLAIGRNAVADKATGATSADNGPGIAMGSAAFKVGFRGDGTIYPSTTGSGFWRQKINGTYYQTLLFADGSTGLPALTAPSITFSSTSGIIGTTTNNNAAAGSVGEFVESFVPSASAVSLTSTVNANVTTISLGAGDWDVSGHVGFLSGTTTNIVQTFGWTLDASASLPNEASYVKTQSPSGGTVIGANTFSYDVPTKRYSFTTTTTVYLSVRAEFSIAALSGYGYISARRRR